MSAASCRLRRHSDYQSVYKASRKQFGRQMSYFFRLRPQFGQDGLPFRGVASDAPRVGLTVGKVMGKAVDRNRIKRRMREAIRSQIFVLNAPVDIVLHPRRSVIDLDLPSLEREVAYVFRAVRKGYEKQAQSLPPAAE